MDTTPPPGSRPAGGHLNGEADRDFAWEAERIAEAEADVAAGRLIDAMEIDAWIDSIGTDQELPPPGSRR